jgi:Mlc titration factor MtfA (ptsG expression regulator)
VIFGLYRAWRRRTLLSRPHPEAWAPILDEHAPYRAGMDDDERARFDDHLKLFAWTKHFEGVKGVEIDDEVRVVISAAAARLARNLPFTIYDHLTEVVVYPSHYKHEGKDGIVFGEAHRWGVVVLSWDATLHGLANPDDGHDTALHEFAHVLDNADGAFDGTPILEGSADYHAWTKAFSAAFLRLRKRPGRRRAALRDYGATNEAEFFAVATEAFFEKPRQLKRKEPDLYRELARYYRVDPAGRSH